MITAIGVLRLIAGIFNMFAMIRRSQRDPGY